MIDFRGVSGLKGLVFDLDDTLYLQADYKRSGFNAIAEWLAEREGIEANQTRGDLERILQCKGTSYPRMFDDFVTLRGLNPELTEKLVDLFIAHQPRIDCFSGVNAMLEDLRRRYRLGLLTDGRQSSQRKKIEALNLAEVFDAVLLSERIKLSKPAQELFLWFEKEFSLSGSALAYIGDNSQKDFFGANQRGWLTVRVLTGEHALLEATGAWRADIELSKVTELTDWLEKWD